VSPDPRLVAAIVDRVTFNAHILETGTQSYLLPAPHQQDLRSAQASRLTQVVTATAARTDLRLGNRASRRFFY